MMLSSFPSKAPLVRNLATGLLRLAVFGIASALAQTPSSQTGQPPGVAGGQPAKINDNSLVKVNYINSPVMAIIPVYTELTGKKMILDSSLQAYRDS